MESAINATTTISKGKAKLCNLLLVCGGYLLASNTAVAIKNTEY